MQTLALIDVSELQWFEVTCSKCRALFTFDVSNPDSNANFLEFCPSCREGWGGPSSVVAAFRDLKNFYATFKDTKLQPRFRVNVPPEHWHQRLSLTEK